MPPIKARVLESELQRLSGFSSRSVRLEQYETPPELAARAVLAAETCGAIEGALVLDACCGPGVLGVGAALLGAGAVVCADVDPAALAVLQSNKIVLAERHPQPAHTLHPILCDLLQPDTFRWSGVFDTVLMNPPFGTKHNAGVDVALLDVAIRASRTHVFSFHKTTTRRHVEREGRARGVHSEVLAEMRFELPRTLRFHTKNSQDVAVDLWHFTHE